MAAEYPIESKFPAPIGDCDIWRTARLFRAQHGEAAHAVAIAHGDALLDQGDVEGCTSWIKIAAAIDTLAKESDALTLKGDHAAGSQAARAMQKAIIVLLFKAAVASGWALSGVRWAARIAIRR